MQKIPTVFFGTHQFAAAILEGLIQSDSIDVQLIITQPDKPIGRKQEVSKSPVKIMAEKYGIQVEQPSSLKNYHLSFVTYNIGIVAQYGLLIPQNIINSFKYGILNVHTSILPKYRGASPIQTAIINGDSETGVTIMKLDKGLDTGPILFQKTSKIGADETYPEVEKKLADLSVQTLNEILPKYISNAIAPIPQDESRASFCKELTRENGKIDWTKSAKDIYNLYRGLTPWPGVWTIFSKKRLKLIRLRQSQNKIPAGVARVTNDKILIGCKDCSIEAIELQIEGGKPMDAKTFFLGHRQINSANLG